MINNVLFMIGIVIGLIFGIFLTTIVNLAIKWCNLDEEDESMKRDSDKGIYRNLRLLRRL